MIGISKKKTIKMLKASDQIEKIINETISNYDGDYKLEVNDPFEELISFGEIVDRLAIVNFKLYTLKDEVIKRPEDKNFRSWASEEDVKLCKERSRLKTCIDKKILTMFKRYSLGDNNAGFNPETKKYGD